METIKIKIGEKNYNVKLAQTEEDQSRGLSGLNDLPDNEGMLFEFKEPDEVSFWMKDTLIPLDIVFINENLKVISVHQGVPNTEDMITEKEVMYVLEVNQNSGIKASDELIFKPDLSKDKMHVLDAEGNSQMELEGGERIFSRNHTKRLIKFAEKALESGQDKDYIILGKKMFEFLETQDNTPAEYVEK